MTILDLWNLWAIKHGFIHVRRVSKEDAHIILEPLGLHQDTDAYNDAFGALIFGIRGVTYKSLLKQEAIWSV